MTAWQGAWGGPLWWPAVVGVVSMPAFAALGFAAGVLRPSRFTAPLVAIGVFLALQISLQFIHGDDSYWQISPLVAAPGRSALTRRGDLLPLPARPSHRAGAVPRRPDRGAAGHPRPTRRRRRPAATRCAAAITTVGLLAAGTAVGLAGTGRLDAHGMIAIPLLHNAGNDRPCATRPSAARPRFRSACTPATSATCLP
ncbi:hypothetical protein NKG94_51320 [Micromonospora sp. M12]